VVLAEERSAASSSVLNQLMRELEPRLWSDLGYRFRGHGSANAIRQVGETEILSLYKIIRRPSNLSLMVVGDADFSRVRALAEEMLGAAEEGDQETREEEPGGEPPRLGARLQIQADLSQKHAVVAYRLPPSADYDVDALMLLAEYIRRSRAMSEAEKSIGGDIILNLDTRRDSGVLYAYAVWSGNKTSEGVIGEITGLIEQIGGADIEEAKLEAARKALLISYWSNRQAIRNRAMMLAGRAALGLALEGPGSHYESLDPGALQSVAAELLRKENRLNLVTIEQ
jgi:predicted Zn-dependent peptidase